MIVPMSNVSVVGPRALLPDVLEGLQEAGVLDIRAEPVGLDQLGAVKRPVLEHQLARERSLEELARMAREALALLPAVPGFEPGATAPGVEAPGLDAWLAEVHAQAKAASDLRAALEDEQRALERHGHLLEAIAPLLAALARVEAVELIGVVVRSDARVDELLEPRLHAITGGAHTILSREHDEHERALIIIVPRDRAAAVNRLLAELGISELRGHVADRPFAESLASLVKRGRTLPAEVASSRETQLALARRLREPLNQTVRDAEDRLAQLRALGHSGETHHLFIVSGYVPSRCVPELARMLAEATARAVALIENPIAEADRDEIPVVLDNPWFLAPFEVLLGLLPPPRYGSLDPTPLLAVSFPLLYGLMLGDIGYGAVILVLALIVWCRRAFGDTGQRLAFIAICCALASIVFGVLFGECFGDLGSSLGLAPVLRSRAEPRTLLGVVLAIGVIHLAIGVALGLWMAIRRGRGRAIAAAATKLGFVCASSAVAAERLGWLGAGLGHAALVAAVGCALLFVVFEGVVSPLEIIKLLGNVLSYARLMAIGIASVMLADVANRMTTLLTPLAFGVLVAIVLHVVNLALGVIGPAVQATRLHFVELFDKFYESGGRSYMPLSHRGGTPWIVQ
jgi:V/A-type H+-transporting ATPase subunit I